MRWLLPLLMVVGCGKDPDFVPPSRDDTKMPLDLASNFTPENPDMSCFNTACGSCSDFANWDGTPVKVGDPCLWKGTWQCMGTTLACSDNGCPACGTGMVGSVCGADGHTILELTDPGSGCRAYDFGSAISLCNRTPTDHCVGKCTVNGNRHDCVAHCLSDDGGGTGCEHMSSDTCESLSSC